jgi:hypothetical protein
VGFTQLKDKIPLFCCEVMLYASYDAGTWVKKYLQDLRGFKKKAGLFFLKM